MLKGHGKAVVANLQDLDGQIQIYVRLDDVGPEAHDLFLKADLGDIYGVKVLSSSPSGEISVHAREFIPN